MALQVKLPSGAAVGTGGIWESGTCVTPPTILQAPTPCYTRSRQAAPLAAFPTTLLFLAFPPLQLMQEIQNLVREAQHVPLHVLEVQQAQQAQQQQKQQPQREWAWGGQQEPACLPACSQYKSASRGLVLKGRCMWEPWNIAGEAGLWGVQAKWRCCCWYCGATPDLGDPRYSEEKYGRWGALAACPWAS